MYETESQYLIDLWWNKYRHKNKNMYEWNFNRFLHEIMEECRDNKYWKSKV